VDSKEPLDEAEVWEPFLARLDICEVVLVFNVEELYVRDLFVWADDGRVLSRRGNECGCYSTEKKLKK